MKDPAGGRAALGAGFARLSDWLGYLLNLGAVIATLLVLAFAWTLVLVLRLEADVSSVSRGSMDTVDTLTHLFRVAYLIAVVVTGLVWLIWQHRLATAAPTALKHSPATQVVRWCIPFGSLVLPRRDISDLWISYGVNLNETEAQRSPTLITMWWSCWVVQGLLLGSQSALLGKAPTLGQINVVIGVDLLQSLLLVAAAVLARRVVHQLAWRALSFWASV